MSNKVQALLTEYSQDPDGDHMCDYPEVEQWKVYYRKIVAALRSDFKKANFSDIKFTRGHKALSGFVTYSNGSIVYISISADFDPHSVLIRTATSYKDYSGGSNNYAKSNSIVDSVISLVS